MVLSSAVDQGPQVACPLWRSKGQSGLILCVAARKTQRKFFKREKEEVASFSRSEHKNRHSFT